MVAKTSNTMGLIVRKDESREGAVVLTYEP